jgi:hypothetical protein
MDAAVAQYSPIKALAQPTAKRQRKASSCRSNWLNCAGSRILIWRERPPIMPSVFLRYKSRLMVISSAVLLGAFATCGGPSRNIVGKWRLEGGAGDTVWEFSRNGSVAVGNTRGIYRFGDQGRIKIETPFAKSVYLPEISGDRMILREPGGSKLEFTRITGRNAQR